MTHHEMVDCVRLTLSHYDSLRRKVRQLVNREVIDVQVRETDKVLDERAVSDILNIVENGIRPDFIPVPVARTAADAKQASLSRAHAFGVISDTEYADALSKANGIPDLS